MWKKINLFLVVPGTVLVAMYSLPQELEHIHHLQEHPNEFVPMPYLRKRKNVRLFAYFPLFSLSYMLLIPCYDILALPMG